MDFEEKPTAEVVENTSACLVEYSAELFLKKLKFLSDLK